MREILVKQFIVISICNLKKKIMLYENDAKKKKTVFILEEPTISQLHLLPEEPRLLYYINITLLY